MPDVQHKCIDIIEIRYSLNIFFLAKYAKKRGINLASATDTIGLCCVR